MDYNLMIWILMLVVFVSYVGYIWIKYGCQKSISESFYILPENRKYLFSLFCWGFSVPAIVLGNNLLMFLAGSGIVFVGGVAAFKQNKMEHWIHMAGAYGGVFFSQLAILYKYHMWYVSVVFVVLALLLLILNIKNKIWWVEILAFISIVIVLGLIL